MISMETLVRPRSGATLAACLAIPVIIARLAALPLMPIDETRYLSVAWEMWQHHQFLVPTLNGETYAHKPPLLFWLINLGWWLFGTSDWVSRAAIPATGVLSFWLLADIVRQLSPTAVGVARWGPLVLLSTSLWFVYLPLSMFDILLTLCLLVAVDGLLRYLRGGRRSMVMLAGVGLGLGMLTKGPVILLYWLPLALSFSFWRPDGLHGPRHYYLTVLATTLLGSLIVLAWAIPAAITGGPDYARAIFWGQSAGRIAESFAHARPWYWYLIMLMVLVLPWTVVNLWRSPPWATPLQRFACWGFLPPLVLLSLVSGKQIHYLMPTMPFMAIWISSQVLTYPIGRQWGYAALLVLLASLIAILPELADRYYPLAPLSLWTRLAAILPLTFAGLMVLRPRRCWLVLAWPLSLLTLLLLASPAIQRYYDLQPMARRLATLETQDIPLAYAGEYHNQFRFLGRLETNLELIDNERRLATWANNHPNGRVIEVLRAPTARQRKIATYHQPYRGRVYLIVPAARWRAFIAASTDAWPSSGSAVHPPHSRGL